MKITITYSPLWRRGLVMVGEVAIFIMVSPLIFNNIIRAIFGDQDIRKNLEEIFPRFMRYIPTIEFKERE